MDRDRRTLLAVFAGGCLGTVARVGLVEAFPPGHAWPWPTFLANVAGALALGLVMARVPQRRAFLGAGLCGALTTFSTMQLELLELLDDGRTGLAATYAAASLLTGLLAVAVGRPRGRSAA